MTINYIDLLIQRLPCLDYLRQPMSLAVQILLDTYNLGGKIITCGNGGSAADAEHIVGELMKGFLLKRPLPSQMREKLEKAGLPETVYSQLQCPVPAISIVSGVALPTAFANDVDGNLSFAQQILGIGHKNDTFLAISTSGNSQNVIYAAQTASALGLRIIGLTGDGKSRLSEICELTLRAPSSSTPIIQEYHIAIYHALCAQLENLIFGNEN